jgi:ribosomal protein S7
MRKFSTITESADMDPKYEVTVSVRLTVSAANEGEAVYIVENLARQVSDSAEVDVISVEKIDGFEKNNYAE